MALSQAEMDRIRYEVLKARHQYAGGESPKDILARERKKLNNKSQNNLSTSSKPYNVSKPKNNTNSNRFNKINKALDKYYRQKIVYRRIIKGNNRIGVVLNVPKKKPTKIGSFFKDTIQRENNLFFYG